MANRYWVGGTGAWSSTSTANWSAATGLSFSASRNLTTLTTVGSPALVAGMSVWGSTGIFLGTIVSGSVNTWTTTGSGTVSSQTMSAATAGASVPTAADNVFFDANSNNSNNAFTVTMSVTPRLCNDFTAQGLDGTMTLAGSGIGLTVSGSLTFQVTNFSRTYSGTTTFNATTTGKTVTTNGVAFGSVVTFDGVGGGWTLGSAFSCGTNDLTVTNGTFDTSVSNYSVTAGRLFSNNANLRTINLNGSTVTVSSGEPVRFTTTNLTFNAGTSTLNCSNSFPTFAGAGLTYYNVSFTSTATQPIITGANTFNNLSITGRTTIGVGAVTIYANQIINGTFTVSAGTASAYRIMIYSDIFNTPRTLTCAAVSLTDTDFRDITIAGAAAPASGTRLGDAKGNSGITFTAAKTVYYRQTGSADWGATGSGSWSATSGGALDGTMFPLPQDTAVFPAATYPASGSTTTINLFYNFGTIDMSLRTSNTMTLATGTTALSIYGNWITGTGITISGTGILTFGGRTTQQITSAGKTFTQPITINSPGGSVTLQDALNIGTGALLIPQGTFDTSSSGNYAVTAASLQLNQTKPRGANLNASTITLSAQYPISIPSALGGLTWNAGTSTINCTSTIVAWFPGATHTYYNVAFTSPPQSTQQLGVSTSDASIFNNLTITGRAFIGVGVLSVGASHTINGTFTVSAGTAAAYRIAIVSSVVGTTRTLTCAAVSLTDVDFRDITINGAAAPASGTRLGDCKGNSGITFTAAKTVYYGQTGSASWGETGSGSWSATSGGALDATMFPLAQDTAVFPAAIYPASSATTTINTIYNIGTIDMALRTSATMTLATGVTNPVIYGNWINGTGITISGTGTLTFAGRTTQTITSAGISFTQPITINSPSGTVQLQDALTTGTTRTTTLTNGTLDLQSYTLSTGLFLASNSLTRSIAFGTGQISCTGTGTVWDTNTVTNLTTTGTQVVNVTSVGSITITVFTGALSEANSISFNFTGGTYGLSFLQIAGYTARSVNFTGYSGGVSVINTPIIYGNLTLSAGMTLTSYTGAAKFGATSGTQQITTNTRTIPFPLNFDGVGGTFQLQDALTMSTGRSVTLTNGTLNLNGQILTNAGSFITATGTKNLTFNAGTLVCPAATTTAFNNAEPTNFTTTAGTGTGTISMTAATAKTFVGGGSTFNCTLRQGGLGALTITGSNTFSNITNTVQPASVLFTAATTSTFSIFSLSGTAGNLITIGSDTAASHTLSKASGTVSRNYLSISQSIATGGANWYAGANSTDGGNNSGWLFIAPPAPSSNSNFLMFF